MTAHAIRAILLAMAMEATRASFLAKRATKRGSTASGLSLARRTSEAVPTTSSYRRYLSPVLVMRPNGTVKLTRMVRGVQISPDHTPNSIQLYEQKGLSWCTKPDNPPLDSVANQIGNVRCVCFDSAV